MESFRGYSFDYSRHLILYSIGLYTKDKRFMKINSRVWSIEKENWKHVINLKYFNKIWKICRVDAKEEGTFVYWKTVIDPHWHELLNGKLKSVISLNEHLKLVFKISNFDVNMHLNASISISDIECEEIL